MLTHILLVCALVACSKRDELAADPAAASTQIKTLAAANCGGFSRALNLLANTKGRLLIGLVDDAVAAAEPTCAIEGRRAAHALAHARRADDRPADALQHLHGYSSESAVRIRRAELLDRLGRGIDAIRDLDASGIADEQAAVTRRTYFVAAAAGASRHADVANAIANAPIAERTSLAFRAAAETKPDELDALARAAVSDPSARTSTSNPSVSDPSARTSTSNPSMSDVSGRTSTSNPSMSDVSGRTPVHELANAVADRIEQERGPAAALAARERAVAGAPELAEYHDALARAQIASGKTDEALASWDRASTIAPAQSAYRITPIRALVIANDRARANDRAAALAKSARERANDVELRVTASAGAAAAGDTALAIELAREARELRRTDGRLAFLLAQRHAEAKQLAPAAELYAELLVCGAHGKPWHRHEVSAKLGELGDRATILAALDKQRACETADPADLASYVDAIKK
jgi:tetratricopeptide (TPR) repeat protein